MVAPGPGGKGEKLSESAPEGARGQGSSGGRAGSQEKSAGKPAWCGGRSLEEGQATRAGKGKASCPPAWRKGARMPTEGRERPKIAKNHVLPSQYGWFAFCKRWRKRQS